MSLLCAAWLACLRHPKSLARVAKLEATEAEHETAQRMCPSRTEKPHRELQKQKRRATRKDEDAAHEWAVAHFAHFAVVWGCWTEAT